MSESVSGPRIGWLRNGCPAASIDVANAAPRCGAKGKRTGLPCRMPAMKNGRCCFHGGKTPKKLKRGQLSKEEQRRRAAAARRAERDATQAAIEALRDTGFLRSR